MKLPPITYDDKGQRNDSGGRKKSDEKAKLKQSRERFKLSTETFGKQRKREKADLEFQEPEKQWAPEAAAARRGQDASGGLPAIPARPMLSISQIDQPCQLVMNQIRSAHLGINIHPLSEDASKENAEVLQGLIRRIEQDCHAYQAREWAAERAAKAGWGVYRINTRYADSRDKPLEKDEAGRLRLTPEDFDQVLVVERILRQEYAHFDPSAQKPDFSDGEFAFLESWMPFDEFKRQYPKAETSKLSETELAGQYEEEAPDWTTMADGKGQRAIRVVDYYYKVHEPETAVLLRDGTAMLKSDLPPGVPLEKQGVVAEREFSTTNVLLCKHTATEVLEEGDWDSPYIPLIPVIGKEQIPFDGERRWVGIIGPAKDGQRFYNVSASTVVENMLLEPKTPFIGDPRQFEGFENWWAQANTRAFAFLPANLIITPDGGAPQLLPAPQRVPKDTTGMSLAMLGLQEAKTFVQSVTGIYDPGLGELAARRQGEKQPSGKAILALQGQSDAGNSHYLQNLAQISMPYEALVLLSKIPTVYDRPGRVARLLDIEDKSKSVMLNAPFYQDDTGQPVRYDQKQWDGQPRDDVKTHDLRTGVYSVTVSIGKSYQSRLQQGREELGQLLPNLPPEYQLLFLPTYLKFLDTPGSDEMSKAAARVRDRQFGNVTDDGPQKSPEQTKAELEAAQGKVKQLEGMVAKMSQAIETDQAKQSAQLQKAQMDNAAKLAQTEQDNQAKLVIEHLKAQTQVLLKFVEGQNAAKEREHQAGMARAQAGLQMEEAEAGRLHESTETARSMDYQTAEAEQDRSFQEAQADLDRSSQSDEAAAAREHEAQQAEQDRMMAEKQAQMEQQQGPEEPA
jgi:portal protein